VTNNDTDEISEQLTAQQAAFLEWHNISTAEVFDAAGYSQPEWREQMSLYDMVVAINVRPCRRAHHTMRTSGGHCAQCRPENLAFQERWRQEAYIYIAGSQEQRILKVGFSQSPYSRADHLNALRYGSASDWTLLFYVRCKRAGAIEHSLLAMHRNASVFGEYWKDRKYQKCFELLRCNYSTLRVSLSDLVDDATLLNAWEHERAASKYNWRL
jgi:hypothetical protein